MSKSVRNKYSIRLRETKMKYYTSLDLIDECPENSKKFFCVIKLLPKRDSPKNIPPYN